MCPVVSAACVPSLNGPGNQVDASAQDLLKRLSVFRGGFTRTAAQEAAGASLRGLSQLVDKALLRRDPDTGRYSIHELLRQYAEEQLKFSLDEERAAHESHAKYFADLMKRCETNLHSPHARDMLAEIAADLDNIRVAWDYWVDKQNPQRILEFISALWEFFEVRGSFIPAIQFFRDAAKKLTTNKPDVVWAPRGTSDPAGVVYCPDWFTGGGPADGAGKPEDLKPDQSERHLRGNL